MHGTYIPEHGHCSESVDPPLLEPGALHRGYFTGTGTGSATGPFPAPFPLGLFTVVEGVIGISIGGKAALTLLVD